MTSLLARLSRAALVALPLACLSFGASAQPLLRQIGLAELGFADGVRLDGLGASRELFFPIPRGIAPQAAVLKLRIDSNAVFAGRRALEILANGRRVLSRQLPDGGTAFELAVPLAAEHLDLEAGFLRLTLRSTGAITDNRCLDTRLAGEHVTLLPGSDLELRLPEDAPLGVATLFRLLPREVAVVTRAGALPPAEAAAALAAAHTLAASGRRVSFVAGAPPALTEAGVWTRGAVLVGATQGEDAIAIARQDGVPVLTLSGAQPERAARLLAEGWRPLAQPAAMPGWAARAPGAVGQRDLPLAALRGDLSAQDVVDRGSWTVDFAARDLPPGTRPAAFALDIAAAPDSAGERPVAAVFLNEVLIGSAALGAATPERLQVAIPAGLAGLENRLRVVVQRRPRGGECETLPIALPAQLLPSSALLLAETSDAPADFFDLAPRLADGVAVLFDSPPEAAALAPALAILRTQLRPGAPIAVRNPGEAPGGPFLAIGTAPPAGIAAPPVRFDRGRVLLTDREGRTLLDLAGTAAGPVAQLVAVGAVPGIWLRPGEGALPAVLRLDRGNVAFADATGIALAWSSGRDELVRVRYPDNMDLLAILGRYRPWIVGAVWLGLTALVVAGIARRWRRRNADAG